IRVLKLICASVFTLTMTFAVNLPADRKETVEELLKKIAKVEEDEYRLCGTAEEIAELWVAAEALRYGGPLEDSEV
ncbi:hypothetical protein BDZ91DRAFT_724971, partial [Kalaharituber pfeilii]